MTRAGCRKEERMFTIELNSKDDVKNISWDRDERIIIEGSIGTFIKARFLEDIVLEVIGSKGELRVDLAKNDLQASPIEAEVSGEGRGNGK